MKIYKKLFNKNLLNNWKIIKQLIQNCNILK